MVGQLIDVAAVAFLAMLGVALWTLRTVYVARGDRVRATMFGAIEAMVFVSVVSKVITPLEPIRLVGYGLGVSAGTYVGSWLGNLIGGSGALEVRTIVPDDHERLGPTLRARGWPVTTTRASGISGCVAVLVTIVDRRDKDRYLRDVAELAPEAFWTVEEIADLRAVARPYGSANAEAAR